MADYRLSFSVFDGKEFEPLLARFRLREKLAQRELVNAINKGARESIRLSQREWDDYFQIRAGYANNKFSMLPATDGKPRALVHARSRATRANNFRYRIEPGRRGVFLNVTKGGSGGVLKHAFVIPRARSDGKPLLVERLVPYQKGERRDFKHGSRQLGRFNRAEQLRFKAIYGPSVNQHFHDSRYRVAPQAMSAAKQQFLNVMKQHSR